MIYEHYRKSTSVLHSSVNPQPKVQERFSTLPRLWGNGLQGNKSWPNKLKLFMNVDSII